MSGDSYLKALVLNKCKELGHQAAAEFFGVQPGLVRQWVHGSKQPSLAAVEKVFSPPAGPAVEAAWEGKEIFLAAPFYRTTNPRTLFSLLAVWERPKYGYRHRFGDAFIAHARNKLAADFLLSSLPVCQWVDDDIIFPCGQPGWFIENTKIPLPPEFAARHGPNRLRSHGKTLVGALYYGRRPEGRGTYHEALISDVEDKRSRNYLDILQETEWVGTGFLQHTREVLLDIQKALPHLAPQHASENWHYFSGASDTLARRFSEVQSGADAVAEAIGRSAEEAGTLIAKLKTLLKEVYESHLREDRLQQGEDQLFCRRAKLAGHQPYVDLGLICGHVDGEVVYGPHNTGKGH